MENIFIYNDIKIIVEYKDNKNMYLKIKNDKPYLILPKGVSEKQVVSFLDDSLFKIVERIQSRKLKSKWSFENDLFIFICGIKYKIIVHSLNSNKRTKILKEENVLNVYMTYNKQLDKEIWKWLKKEAYKLQKPIMDEWASHMNLEYKLLKINSSRTRWGSCNTRTNDINLSVQLYLEPLSSQVYVIIHELAHLRWPNHSKDFWCEVEKYLPEYKKYSKILKY